MTREARQLFHEGIPAGGRPRRGQQERESARRRSRTPRSKPVRNDTVRTISCLYPERISVVPGQGHRVGLRLPRAAKAPRTLPLTWITRVTFSEVASAGRDRPAASTGAPVRRSAPTTSRSDAARRDATLQEALASACTTAVVSDLFRALADPRWNSMSAPGVWSGLGASCVRARCPGSANECVVRRAFGRPGSSRTRGRARGRFRTGSAGHALLRPLGSFCGGADE